MPKAERPAEGTAAAAFVAALKNCLEAGLGRRGQAEWRPEDLAALAQVGERTIRGWLAGNGPPKHHRFEAVLGVFRAEPTDKALVGVLITACERWRAERSLADEPRKQETERKLPSLCTLRPRVGDFTGREQELARLCALLTGGERKAVISAIGGMGGVGKTTLALEAAWRVAGQFPDGVLFVDLRGFGGSPMRPEDAMAALIRQIEPGTGQLPGERDELLPLYRRFLAGRRRLLLLDNARDLAQVKDLVPPEPAALLVTSRNRIQLPAGKLLDLGEMAPDEASALLRAVLGDHREVSEAERATIARSCGRLPIALRAAGDFLVGHPGWTVAEYLEELAADRFAHLPEVERVLHFSVEVLEQDRPDLAGWFRTLAVFPASFDRAAAAAVWAIEERTARAALDDLAARSLVLLDAESGRFRLHDLVRDLASERLDAAAREVAQARHAGHYGEVLAKADDLFLAGHDGVLAGLALFDAERANIEAGQTWAAARVETSDAAARLAYEYTDAGVYVLSLRLPARTRIAWLEAAAEACRRTGDRQGLGNALGNLGLAWAALGEARKAIELYEQRLAIAREIGDRRGEGNALGNLGLAWAALGETRKAIELYEQHLAIAREIGDRRGEGNALWNGALAHEELGERDRAVERAAAAWRIRRAIEDPNGPKVAAWLRERGVDPDAAG